MEAKEYFMLRNNGKPPELMVDHQEAISPTWAVTLMEDYHTLKSKQTACEHEDYMFNGDVGCYVCNECGEKITPA